MIGQVFKTVHEDDEGWLGTGDDQTGSSAMGMADDYLAQSISKGGGLGLGKNDRAATWRRERSRIGWRRLFRSTQVESRPAKV